MFGADVPDLATTPCAACGAPVAPADVVWDPWHLGDRRLAALPYHRACAAEILPPDDPDAMASRCAICAEPLAPAVMQAAVAVLRARFHSARGTAANPEVVWRLASREPRAYVPEHLACLLRKLGGQRT